MNGWAITWIVLNAIGLGFALSKHGEPKTGNYSFWITLAATLIEAAVLYMAGLWN